MICRYCYSDNKGFVVCGEFVGDCVGLRVLRTGTRPGGLVAGIATVFFLVGNALF